MFYSSRKFAAIFAAHVASIVLLSHFWVPQLSIELIYWMVAPLPIALVLLAVTGQFESFRGVGIYSLKDVVQAAALALSFGLLQAPLVGLFMSPLFYLLTGNADTAFWLGGLSYATVLFLDDRNRPQPHFC